MSLNLQQNPSDDPIQKRYKIFCDQNPEEGRFDVTFQFQQNSQESEGNSAASNDNKTPEFVHAHSQLLWPSSKVFEKTFFGPLAHKGPISVVQHSCNDFKEFLTFFYLGKCNITMDNVMALVDLGEYYEIKLLKDQCDEFLTQNSTKIENVLKVYESLKVYSLENAMKKVMEFVESNTVEIIKSDEFLNVKKETILDIAKLKNLMAKQEEVFEAIFKWAEHNCPEDNVNKHEFLKSQLEDVIPFIDFSIMDFDFLNNFVVRKGFLFPSFDAIADALCEAATKKKMAEEERLKILSQKKQIKLTNSSGQIAYADIYDQAVITSLETAIANRNPRPHKANSSFCQWLIPVNMTDKYYLVRDNSGYISLKLYRPGYDTMEDVIARVMPQNGSFIINNSCKIELV